MKGGNVSEPTGWPRPATPCDLVPAWAGEFRDFNDWVSKATPRLAGAVGSYGQEVAPICVDAKGRRCNIGGDFMRARDEDAFPVRYFWEMKPAPANIARPESEWHEDFGPCLWWIFPVAEAPWCGGPLDSDWPGYHTHFTRLPAVPINGVNDGGEGDD